jgi:hypothetical protein
MGSSRHAIPGRIESDKGAALLKGRQAACGIVSSA